MAEAALKQNQYVYSSPLPESVERTNAIPRPRAIPRPAFRPRLSTFAVVGFLFIAFLTVMCIYSQIELTKISAEITGIKAVSSRIKGQTGIVEKLNEQIALNNALQIEYERAFDLKEIEIYATQVLGMVRAQNASESMNGTAKSDKAVIPASVQNSGGVKKFFEWVTEYFS